MRADEFSLPPPAEQWHLRCQRCGSSNPVYWLDLDRLNTIHKAFACTAHLCGKRWFANCADSWFQCINQLFPGLPYGC
jgi:hypothetical protein